jgi:hypothetical protein
MKVTRLVFIGLCAIAFSLAGQSPNFESKRAKLAADITATLSGTSDPLKLANLPDQTSRDEAKRFATSIKAFTDANAPGGTKFTDQQLQNFRNEMAAARRSGNPAVKAMAIDASWLLMQMESVVPVAPVAPAK